MRLTICDYCGTEYDAKKKRCPRCGSESAGNAVGKKRDSDRISGKQWAVISCVLGLAVLIGLIAFILQMGYFDEGFDLNAIPTNLEQTVPQEAEIYPDEAEEPEEVEDRSCTDLVISQNEVVLRSIHAKNFLTAVASPSDCEDEIEFVSSDETVVLVDDRGVISAAGPGMAEIIVTCGDFTQVCTVICDFELPEEETEETMQPEEQEPEEEKNPEETLPNPEVVPADFTLRTPGEEAYLAVNNVPEGTAVTFTSNNPAVVSVTQDGKVRAESEGQTTIVIMVGDVRLESIARCNLSSTTEGGDTTENGNTGHKGPFKISHSDVTFSFAGESFTISLIDADGKAVSGLTWVTGNSGVCSVSGSTVKAVGGGQTMLTTTYNGTTYSCIVRCNF